MERDPLYLRNVQQAAKAIDALLAEALAPAEPGFWK